MAGLGGTIPTTLYSIMGTHATQHKRWCPWYTSGVRQRTTVWPGSCHVYRRRSRPVGHSPPQTSAKRPVGIHMTYTQPAHGNLTEDAHDPRPAFLAMFEAVRAYLLSEGSSAEARGAVATNPKGEATRGFDATAERIALGVASD